MAARRCGTRRRYEKRRGRGANVKLLTSEMDGQIVTVRFRQYETLLHVLFILVVLRSSLLGAVSIDWTASLRSYKVPPKHSIMQSTDTVFWEQSPNGRRNFSFPFLFFFFALLFFLVCVAAQWTVAAHWTTAELPITIPKLVWAVYTTSLHLIVSAC